MSNNINIFYHIYCTRFTLNIVKEQTDHILFSRLYETVDNIYCFITGEPKYMEHCMDYISNLGTKYKIVETIPNDKTAERFTLLKIKKYIKEGDKLLYLHTKGVTKPDIESIRYWRLYMQYFLMVKHDTCLKDLDEYDTVGIMWRESPSKHFSGNFWWATAKYFLRLPDTIGPEYIDPEMYIGLSNPRYKCYSDTYIPLYVKNITPNIYI